MKWAYFPENSEMDTNIHNYHHMGWPLYRNRGSQDHQQLDPEEMTGCTRLLKETYTQPPTNQPTTPSIITPSR